MQGDYKIGRRRLVDITILSCSYSHCYWQEKDMNLSERFCDNCFQTWLIRKWNLCEYNLLGGNKVSPNREYRAKRLAEWWDKNLRRKIIGEDY